MAYLHLICIPSLLTILLEPCGIYMSHQKLFELFQPRGGGGGLDPESPTVNEGASSSGSSSGDFNGGSSRVLARGGRI